MDELGSMDGTRTRRHQRALALPEREDESVCERKRVLQCIERETEGVLECNGGRQGFVLGVPMY